MSKAKTFYVGVVPRERSSIMSMDARLVKAAMYAMTADSATRTLRMTPATSGSRLWQSNSRGRLRYVNISRSLRALLHLEGVRGRFSARLLADDSVVIAFGRNGG